MPRIATATPDEIRSAILTMLAEAHDTQPATLGRAINAKMANSKSLIHWGIVRCIPPKPA